MSRPRLDRSRYHSTVHGERGSDDPLADVHYYQDGFAFDAGGNLLEDLLSDEQRAALERRTKAPRQAPALSSPSPLVGEGWRGTPSRSRDGDPGGGSESSRESHQPSTPTPIPSPQGGGEPSASAAESEVNLELWLTGEQKYLFDQVQAAIRARYSRSVNTAVDAVDFLVLEQSLVDIDKVSKKLAPHLGP